MPPRRLPLLALVLAAGGPSAPLLRAQAPPVEDSLGAEPASPRAYDDVVRESFYIPMPDGVRLAADLYRPARGEVAETRPLPLVWTHDRYHRAGERDGRVFTKMGQPVLRELVRRGYLVAAVDVRGSGASFGSYEVPFGPAETRDAARILEWFAAQPWCDGKLGMYGGSYLGATQFMAAAAQSPHLKAIIPAVAVADLYSFCYPGGVYREDFIRKWSDLTVLLDTQVLPARVDADAGGGLRAAARKEHALNLNTEAVFSAAPFRNSVNAALDILLYPVTSPITYREAISSSGVAIYHIGGWYDCFTRDTLLMYRNLRNPQRIAIGPWFHQERHRFDDAGEHLRWFDRWLKGIDNGIDREPPVHYFVMGAAGDGQWRTADAWPLPDEQRTSWYFHGNGLDPSAGRLSQTKPAAGALSVNCRVDYTASSGVANRWRNGYGGPAGYGDMAPNDRRGASFTSGPLDAALEVTGHPEAEIWAGCTASDADFFVYLEDVDGGGFSRYVTEGTLRASQRALARPDFDCFGLPWHRCFAEDAEPLGEDPVELRFDLLPTSYVFAKGHRVRITVTFADAGNCRTPRSVPPPVVRLLAEPGRASRVVLPEIPTVRD